MNREAIVELIEEAALAPSVHNTQPARWKIDGSEVFLFEDLTKRLKVGDPTGHDAAMSLGAAFEGFSIAASNRNLSITPLDVDKSLSIGNLRAEARFQLTDAKQKLTPDPLGEFVETRKSWRGAFLKSTDADQEQAHALSADDCSVITDKRKIDAFCTLVDDASFSFMRDKNFRHELVSWMRLSKRDQNWSTDGLNADAMRLNALEALAAKLVMGPLFTPLDKLALASKLLAEAEKTRTAAAIVIFHRPRSERPFESGRHFYRLWLRMEKLGFSAAVLAALADNKAAAEAIAAMIELPSDQRIVSAFRIGREDTSRTIQRARRATSDLFVD